MATQAQLNAAATWRAEQDQRPFTDLRTRTTYWYGDMTEEDIDRLFREADNDYAVMRSQD